MLTTQWFSPWVELQLIMNYQPFEAELGLSSIASEMQWRDLCDTLCLLMIWIVVEITSQLHLRVIVLPRADIVLLVTQLLLTVMLGLGVFLMKKVRLKVLQGIRVHHVLINCVQLMDVFHVRPHVRLILVIITYQLFIVLICVIQNVTLAIQQVFVWLVFQVMRHQLQLKAAIVMLGIME